MPTSLQKLDFFAKFKLGQAVSSSLCNRVLGLSLLQHEFRDTLSCKSFAQKEQLWDHAVTLIGPERPVTYFEFGVWEGYSFKHFLNRFVNAQSRFIGFDSFMGLPEDWIPGFEKGSFAVAGAPEISDARGSFVKGWFQNTVLNALNANADKFNETVLIHYDADLYSSTLFLMSTIHPYFDSYWCIFDEFPGQECRALSNYLQAYGAKVEFIAAVHYDRFPVQTLCRITTNRSAYSPS